MTTRSQSTFTSKGVTSVQIEFRKFLGVAHRLSETSSVQGQKDSKGTGGSFLKEMLRKLGLWGDKGEQGSCQCVQIPVCRE